MSGNDGVDDIRGCKGHDLIAGGGGNDRLQGNAGDDTFIFGQGSGRDRIVDFDRSGDDSLDLTDFGFADFEALSQNMVQIGDHVLIDLGDGDEILLLNTNILDIEASDFMLTLS